MSDDSQERNPRGNDWTPRLLKEYTDQRIDWLRVYADRRLDDLEKSFTTHLAEAREALNAAMTAATKAIEAALIASNKAIDAAFAASDKAIDKAEASNKDRFESVNEFRAQLRDQAAQMVTRELFEQAVRDIRSRQDSVQSRIEEIAGQQRELFARTEGGRSTQDLNRQNILAIVAVVGVVISIATIIILFTR